MEIVNFVIKGSRSVTPREAEKFRQHLPTLKIKVETIDAPEFPKLRRRLRFLIELFEDVLDGEFVDLPYTAFAETAFALDYTLRGNDIIPDSLPGLGYADDASIVGAVFMRYETQLAAYAAEKSIDWQEVSIDQE